MVRRLFPCLAACLGACSGDVKVDRVNSAPAVTITQPPSGTVVDEGEPVTFEALVDDEEIAEVNLTWSSDLDGVLDEGGANEDGVATFTTASLGVGNHVVTLQAVDARGKTDEDWVDLTVSDVPDAPEITIIHPLAGEYGTEGTPFEFVAEVYDAQDAPEDLYISFSSDADSVFCEPEADAVGVASCEMELTPGPHTLTFEVRDSEGLTASDSAYYEVIPADEVDADEDGYTPLQGDCDDADPSVNPRAEEVANGADDDCDEAIDEETAVYDDDGDCQCESGPCTGSAGEDCETLTDGDCDDDDDDTWDGATEVCDGLDNDCDGDVDDGTSCIDDDGDGWSELDGDCNDDSDATWPGATEVPDGDDNDCDGVTDEGTSAYDDDGDGYSEEERDCDDGDDEIFPGAEEVCDGDDNDCDGVEDEDDATDVAVWFLDADDDGFGTGDTETWACEAPDGFVDNDEDCDDTRAAVNPDASESCNELDDDCDGRTDEGVTTTYYRDADDDGYGRASLSDEACAAPDGYVTNDDDCDDGDSSVNPLATETCDDEDNDCDGETDEASASDARTWYRDADGDGYGSASSPTVACDRPTGYVSNDEDCDDGDDDVSPADSERCNDEDDNCDGTVDESSAVDADTWYRDADGDGYGNASSSSVACDRPSGYVSNGSDCDDSASSVYPGATESCNDDDDDCDGSTDEGVMSTFYRDADGDGYGNADSTTSDCSAPSGYVSNDDDCDDSDAGLNPATVWYRDADSDDYGTSATTKTQCVQPAGYVGNDDDCNDGTDDAYPGAAETCDDIDNDCDGSADEVNASGCTTRYYDYDGDGYGSESVSGRCYCEDTGYYTADTNTDCYDYNADANPGASSYYYRVNRGDGSYDYNCDDVESRYYTSVYDCDTDWTGFGCDSYTNGFASTSSIPSCGSSGTWRYGCTASWFSCSYSSTTTYYQYCQ